jgi:RNA polymerase sigma-70 factor, ECF subfamily
LIDIELINECRNGNLSNFRRLIELTSPIAFQVAFRMLGDEEEAKDVVQETMITIWQKLKKINSPEGYKSWIYRIVVNKCRDLLRKRKRNPEFIPNENAWAIISNNLSEESSSGLENKEIALIINTLTNRLSPKQKVVFVLSEIEQLGNEEIAKITGMSRSAIKANLHHARKNIAAMVEKYL